MSRSQGIHGQVTTTQPSIEKIMMMRMPVRVTVFALFLGACASDDTQPDTDARDDCFYIRQVNSWDAIDDRHIFVRASVSDQYLLTMFSSCQGIRFANAIALSNSMGRICPNDFGEVTYRDGRMRSSCQISDVERVASKEEAEALVSSRESERHED